MINKIPISSDDNVILDFHASVNGTPIRNKRIECLLYNNHVILYNDSKYTDDNGFISLHIRPHTISSKDKWSAVIDAHFYLMDGSSQYSIEYPIVFSRYNSIAHWLSDFTPETTLQVNSTNQTNVYNIKVSGPHLDGKNESIMSGWRIGNSDYIYNITDPGWYQYDFHPSYVWVHNIDWSGQSYVGTIELPPFLPLSTTISIIGIVEDFNNSSEFRKYFYIENLAAILSNQIPVVSISYPRDNDRIEGSFAIEGTASDDRSIEYVLVRIDGGNWTEVVGTEEWQYLISSERLDEGFHSIEATSFDGLFYSDIDSIEIEFTKVDRSTRCNWTILIIIVIVILICILHLVKNNPSASQ